MALKYHVTKNTIDSHQISSGWVACVIPFALADTFDPSRCVNQTSGLSVSLAEAEANPVDVDDVVIISDEIARWDVSMSKSSHTSQATFTLTPGGVDALHQINSGDWIMFWVHDNMEDTETVRNAIGQVTSGNGVNSQTNDINSGLKFVGRINSVKRSRQISGTIKRLSYTLTAVGFNEFNNPVYFSQDLLSKYAADGGIKFMQDLDKDFHNLILQMNRNGFTSGEMLNLTIASFLGSGPTIGAVDPFGTDPGLADRTATLNVGAPNNSYIVPPVVGRLLGVDVQQPTYKDLLKSYVGVQAYGVGDYKRGSIDNSFLDAYVPDTSLDLSGDFLAVIEDYSNKPVWSILEYFSADPINEIYTGLRLSSDGRIMPSFVARQLPLSSRAFAHGDVQDNAITTKVGQQSVVTSFSVVPRTVGKNKATCFVDLPRWVIDPSITLSETLGQSDSQRVNWMWIYGRDQAEGGGDQFSNRQSTFAKNPPLVDVADIKRSGLHRYERQLNVNLNESRKLVGESPAKAYSMLLADAIMGAHLKWTGYLATKGIQEPIVPGDNVEYDNIIFHIENIKHAGGITDNGMKQFDTYLDLSNGISTDSDDVGQDTNVYPGLTDSDDAEDNVTTDFGD